MNFALVSIMEHSGTDGDPPLNGYEPNVQIEGPENIGVAGDVPLDVDPGSSDSEDEMADYVWGRPITVADRVKLKSKALLWVGRAVSGLRHDRLKSRATIKELRYKVRASQDETNVLQERPQEFINPCHIPSKLIIKT